MTIGKPLARVLLAVGLALLLLGFLWLRSCERERSAKTEAKVSAGQAGAAMQSGGDAVETIGNRAAADARQGQIVEETKDAIRNASDAAGISNAGRDGLCRLAGYRGRPECVQHADPQ